MATEAGGDTVFCRDCGAEISERAEICPECGIRQQGRVSADVSGTLSQYSTAAWIGAVIFALLTFPIGLAIPAYFYIKASRDEPVDQTPLEVWTVILWGILGIVAVEIGGRNGAKVLWGLLAAFILLIFIVLASL